MPDLPRAARLPQAAVRNTLCHIRFKMQFHVQSCRAFAEGAQLLLRDFFQLCFSKRLKGRNTIDAPQKFRREIFPQTAKSRFLRRFSEAEAAAHAVFTAEI